MDMLLPPVARWLLQPDNRRKGLNLLNSNPAGQVLIGLGILLVVLTLARAIRGIYGFCYAYFFRVGSDVKLYGSWAVVTGATDGIGKAYCEALAKKGLNLVLVSRTESKLQACENELRAKFNVKMKHCAADLCKADNATFQNLAECLEGVDVGILINNAGMSYDHPDYLETLSDDTIRDLITINTIAPTALAKLVLPGMKERRRGVIVNVGSGASTALPSGPLLSAYTASKAYIEAFSQSLDSECREFGVRVQNQAPMFVATKLAKIRRPRLDAPTPAVYARAAVAQIGRETSFSPYWFHGLQIALIKLAPTWLVVAYVLRLQKGMLCAYYRKQARKNVEAAVAATSELTDEEPKKGR